MAFEGEEGVEGYLTLSMVEVKICCRILGRFFVSMHRNARPDGNCLMSLKNKNKKVKIKKLQFSYKTGLQLLAFLTCLLDHRVNQ